MKITEHQIERLYTFTRKHFVEWYDVQTELVDHLANGIENQWKDNSNITFDEALNKEFKKFGVFGFSELVEQKINALQKHYRKEIWHELKNYFKLPKIMITLFGVWVLFKMLKWFENIEYAVISIMLAIVCFYFLYLLKETKRIKNIQKQTGKKWLFQNVNKQLGGFVHFLNIGIYMPIVKFNSQWDTLAQLSFSVCIVIYILLLFVSIKVVSPKLREKFTKEYPEYKLL